MRGGGPPSAYSSCVRLQGRGKFLQCHCEDSSTKQSSLSFRVCRAKLDCFAALAMTAGSAHSRSSRYNELRHCLRQTRSVCAGSEATKQSSFVVRKLDCFAALAMTAESVHSRSSPYTALRHCLRQTRSVCAGSEATKQSSFVVRKLDCFAALAMTRVGLFRKSPV